MKTVGMVSLGCSKNRVDSEMMLGMLRAAGYEIVADPAKAEIIIVNTCGFILPAKEESIDTILDMARKGEVPGDPMQFNFVLGVKGCTPATVQNLVWLVNAIPAGSTWTSTGVGRAAFTLAAPTIVMGGNVRVGFEDNIYLSRGVKAVSNGELVEKVVRLSRELGRDIASPEEARRILSLKPLK